MHKATLRRVSAARARLVAALTCGALGAVLAPTSSVAADPVTKDPSTIACPAASPGWFVPASAGGKEVEDGQNDLHLRPSDAVTVNCNYYTSSGRHILVYVQYALPSDRNPINDFYYGCSSTVTRWNATDRVFRLTSSDQWAIAVFYDSLLQLKNSEVAMFENVTRRLLQNAEGYAHDCSLKVAPTPATSSYAFVFDVSEGRAQGSFLVQATPNGDPRAPTVPVIQVQVPNITLNVKTDGVSHVLTIKVKHGITYHNYHAHKAVPTSKAIPTSDVKFAIEVVSSKVPSCRKGATGTLTVSTAPSVLLEVCGQTFLRGHAKTDISLLN